MSGGQKYVAKPRYLVYTDSSDVPQIVGETTPLPVTNRATSSYTGDFMLDIPAGNITGVSSVNKFGRNTSVATSANETVWDGSTIYAATPGFPTSAVITHAWSAVDSAATQGLTIEVQGLDENWAAATDTVTLDGTNSTTAVAFDNATTMIRVFRMKVIDSTAADQLVRCGDSGKANYYAQIQIDENQTQMAIYTVPANKTAYMTKYYASLNKAGGGGDPDGVLKMYTYDRANNYTYQLKHTLGLDANANSQIEHDFKPYFKITEKTDIEMYFKNDSGTATADVSAGFDLIVVDDGY